MTEKVGKLVLLRHGESVWNQQNRFTGWVDVPLSLKGIDEACAAGEKIKNFSFDEVYISNLIRAQMTAFLALSRSTSDKTPYVIHPGDQYKVPEAALTTMIPVYVREELNERHYGDLQGLNKDETREKYGKEQVHIWRRSYDVPPPGNGESLELCAKRTVPWFTKMIVPKLKEGKSLFIAAHGNSLRSIVMEIKKLSKEDVLSLEIATGDPLLFELFSGGWREE